MIKGNGLVRDRRKLALLFRNNLVSISSYGFGKNLRKNEQNMNLQIRLTNQQLIFDQIIVELGSIQKGRTN